MRSAVGSASRRNICGRSNPWRGTEQKAKATRLLTATRLATHPTQLATHRTEGPPVAYRTTTSIPAADADDAARAMIAAAHRWAGRSRWLETMEILTCVSHTPALRRTGIGSSPAMWNFLDNAKLHVEDPSLAGDSADDLGLDGEDWDDGEDGGATGFAEAVAKAEAAAKRLEDGEDGKEDG